MNMKELVAKRYEYMKRFSESCEDENLRRILDGLTHLYDSSGVIDIEEHSDDAKYKLTPNGIRSSKKPVQSFGRSHVVHSVPAILKYLSEKPMGLSELQSKIHLPKYDLVHTLYALAGRGLESCPYVIRGYECFAEETPMVEISPVKQPGQAALP